MFSVVLLCALVCSCVISWWRARLKEARAHPLPPMLPHRLPIIGHVHNLVTSSTKLWKVIKYFSQCIVDNGGVAYFNIGSQVYYVITDPEDAQTVANSCLQKHFAYSFATSWIGEGLLTSSGEKWHRHRKLMNPMFSLPVIHGFLEVFNKQSRALISTLEPYVGRGQFDLSFHVRKNVLETSCLTMFGKIEIKDPKFFSKYMAAADDTLHLIMRRFKEFWLQNEIIFSLSGLKKEETELVKILKGFSDEVITKNRASTINGKHPEATFDYKSPEDIRYQPLLDLILQRFNKDHLNDQEIKEELDTTIAAGYDTSSNFLISALALIGSHPEVQEKMYKEMIQTLGQDRDVEQEDLQKLVYTGAVIKEGLRLLPAAPVIGRYVDKDVKLKNYTLRADSQCFIILYALQCDSCWGADADQFRPERWLDPANLPKNPNTFAAFSIGKRSCIGRAYAMTSFKVMLSHILRKYRVTANTHHTEMKFKVDFTLKPVSGHEISLQRRH